MYQHHQQEAEDPIECRKCFHFLIHFELYLKEIVYVLVTSHSNAVLGVDLLKFRKARFVNSLFSAS